MMAIDAPLPLVTGMDWKRLLAINPLLPVTDMGATVGVLNQRRKDPQRKSFKETLLLKRWSS